MANKPALIITDTPQAAADYAAAAINEQLRSGKRVLVLLPGGSSIQVAALAHQQLDSNRLDQLTLSLTDERYGEVDHPDSNWHQLAEAGVVFDPREQIIPVLNGLSMDDTIHAWGQALEHAFAANDVVFGFFGMGPDGHTCGILPGSPAVESTAYTAGYDAGNFQRITMTPRAIQHVQSGVLYIMGENKRPALQDLATDKPLAEQPAQILKQVPSLTIFTDISGVRL